MVPASFTTVTNHGSRGQFTYLVGLFPVVMGAEASPWRCNARPAARVQDAETPQGSGALGVVGLWEQTNSLWPMIILRGSGPTCDWIVIVSLSGQFTNATKTSNP